MMKKIKTLLFALFFSFGFINAKPIISVSIPPQAYFLKQIAGDSVTINILVPQGADPHTFEFKPSNLYQLQKSDLYLTIGLEFEKIWLDKIKDNLIQTKIIPITQNIPFLKTEHSHQDEDEEEEHESHDPHIWLSPALVKILATNIASILSAYFPEHKELYAKNLQAFLGQIDVLQQTIKERIASLQNRVFLIYHPAWAYFAQEFNLKEIAIQVDDKEPTPQELAQTIALAKEEKVRVLFIQNGFSNQTAIARNFEMKTWNSNPLAYDWENELLHFVQGLLY